MIHGCPDCAPGSACWRHSSSSSGSAQESPDLRAELERIVAMLPEPIWNDKGVLVWSLLDVERVRAALSSSPASPSRPDKSPKSTI